MAANQKVTSAATAATATVDLGTKQKRRLLFINESTIAITINLRGTATSGGADMIYLPPVAGAQVWSGVVSDELSGDGTLAVSHISASGTPVFSIQVYDAHPNRGQ